VELYPVLNLGEIGLGASIIGVLQLWASQYLVPSLSEIRPVRVL